MDTIQQVNFNERVERMVDVIEKYKEGNNFNYLHRNYYNNYSKYYCFYYEGIFK